MNKHSGICFQHKENGTLVKVSVLKETVKEHLYAAMEKVYIASRKNTISVTSSLHIAPRTALDLS